MQKKDSTKQSAPKPRCPYCGSIDVVEDGNTDKFAGFSGEWYECLDCESDFTAEEMIAEINRRQAARAAARLVERYHEAVGH